MNEILASIGAPTAAYAPPTGKLSSLFSWFADDDRLCIVCDRVDVDPRIADKGFGHALGHVGDRDLWVVFPRSAARTAVQRVPFLDVPVSVFAWSEDGVDVEPIPRRSDVFDRLRDTTRGGTHELGALEPLVEDLLQRVETYDNLVAQNRQSYLTWHFHGRQVLEVRAAPARHRVSIVAGVKYSKPGPGCPAPLKLDLSRTITAAEIDRVVAAVEGALDARADGSDDANAEHALQELLQHHLGALGLREDQPLLREVPAVRPGAFGYIDLVGVDVRNHLHVLETKLGPDDGLVLQGLDYWVWASANAKALAKSFGLDDVAGVTIDYVVAEKTPGHGLIGSYSSSQAEALDRSVSWRFITVRDWRHSSPNIQRLPRFMLPLGSRKRPAPRKAEPRWAVRLRARAQEVADERKIHLAGGVLWPDPIAGLLPEAALRYDELRKVGLDHRMVHHALSSQAFALNLFSPLDQAARVALLRGLGVDAVTVEPAVFEWSDADDRLRERTAAPPHMTQVDVLLRCITATGAHHVVLIEVKLSEQDFGHCSAWLSSRNDALDVCNTPGRFGTNSARCFQLRNHDRGERRRYDVMLGDPTGGPVNTHALAGAGCCFRYGASQPMRNVALARVLLSGGEADSVMFGLCAPLANSTIWRRWSEAKAVLDGTDVELIDLPAEAVLAHHPAGPALAARYLLEDGQLTC